MGMRKAKGLDQDMLLYHSERVLDIRGYSTRFVDEESAFQYLDYIVNTVWFHNRYWEVAEWGLFIKETKQSQAYGWFNGTHQQIMLPRWALTDFGLLHELAHICEPCDEEDDRIEHHLEWRRCELALIGRFIGKEAAYCLKHAMLAYGLEV